MITKELIQKYLLNKPTIGNSAMGMAMFMGVFLTMFLTSQIPDLFVFGIMLSGFLTGLSLSFTKNIFFPIGIIVSYNLIVISVRSQLILDYYLLATIFESIIHALFLALIIYWTVILSQYILAIFKKLDKVTDEPITSTKFVIGSIVGGVLYGLIVVIRI